MPTAQEALSAAASSASGAAAGGGRADPAAAAASGAGAGGGAARGAAGSGVTSDAGAGAGAAANQPFWESWDKPEQTEVRDWAKNKNYESPFTLAKTARDLERDAAALRAAKGYPAEVKNPDGTVKAPDENARRAWNQAVGVPDSPEKYDFGLPEDSQFPQFKGLVAQAFLEAGVPAAMAPKLAKGYEGAVQKLLTEAKAAEDAKSTLELRELEREWGSNYQERVSLAARGKEWLGRQVGGLTDEQLRGMENLLGTAKFMNAMYQFGAGNREAGFAGGEDARGGRFQGGASEATQELDALQAKRAAGTISEHEWRELSKPNGKIDQLRDRIVGGMASGTA